MPYLRTDCRYFEGHSTAETQVVEVALDGSQASAVLSAPSQIGDRYASCFQINLLAPNDRSIALHDSQLGMRVARFSDGDWKELLKPAQRPPAFSFDTYSCLVKWTSAGIQIGCASSTGAY